MFCTCCKKSAFGARKVFYHTNGAVTNMDSKLTGSEKSGSERTVREGSASNGALEALFANPAIGGRQVTYAIGSIICEEDHPATDMYYVHKGQVRLHRTGSDGSSLLLEILGVGQWFGVASVAGNPCCGVRAIAVAPSTVTRASAAAVMEHVRTSPESALAMIKEIAARQCAAYEDAARLVFDDCNSRLVKTLLRFSDTAAASKREAIDGGGVVLRITHQQLAQAVGVARETVSLALTQLRKQNMIRTGRNQLFFDPDVLKKFQGSGKGKNTPAQA